MQSVVFVRYVVCPVSLHKAATIAVVGSFSQRSSNPDASESQARKCWKWYNVVCGRWFCGWHEMPGVVWLPFCLVSEDPLVEHSIRVGLFAGVPTSGSVVLTSIF